MEKRYNNCSAEIGSVTQAMKAQNALASAAIPSNVIKTQSSSHRGCVYGISFPCAHENNVRTVLTNAKIPVKRIFSEDGL